MAATMSNKILLNTFFVVLFSVIFCFFVVWIGCFDTAKVDLDLGHYAEKSDKDSFLKMPANALVNIGYIFIGLVWAKKIYHRMIIHESDDDIIFYSVFSWMSIFYGFIQFGRIVSLTRIFAVMDQWITLPIFLWVLCWADFRMERKFALSKTAFLQIFSISSYCLVLLHDRGFECVLGFHILAAVVAGIVLQKRFGNSDSFNSFFIAVVCCGGFVILKLSDHPMAEYSMFKRFTGHFWSKVCDVGQIHFVFRFFESLNSHVKTD